MVVTCMFFLVAWSAKWAAWNSVFLCIYGLFSRPY